MTGTEHDDERTQIPDQVDPVAVRARQRLGQVLCQKWRLDVLLGIGGMAAVYSATHRNGSHVAVKILHPELSVSPEVRTRFLREGYAANAVGHDGVVRVSDDDVSEDGAAFLVMELLEGETLEGRRQRLGRRLSEDEVLSVADQVLDVLVVAHAKGIVHRDLKPENLFLTRDGRVKVLDFGIAHLGEIAAAGGRATRSGHSMGTPSFMGPEQARGLWDQVDGRSDLWSLGATLFTLLSASEVHSGRTATEVMFAAATKPAPTLASLLPGISPAVAAVVDRALAFEREQRWRDAATMQEAVRSAYHDRHGAPISTAPRLTVPPDVLNRTLASGTVGPASPGTATTNGAVAATRLGVSGPWALVSLAARLPHRHRVVLGVGGAVIAAAVGARVLATSGTKSLPSSVVGGTPLAPVGLASSRPTVVSSALPPSPRVPSPSGEPSATRAVAVTDLPLEPAPLLETTKPTPPQTKPLLPAPPNSPAVAGPKANCNPPFTIDPTTGKKNFKMECL